MRKTVLATAIAASTFAVSAAAEPVIGDNVTATAGIISVSDFDPDSAFAFGAKLDYFFMDEVYGIGQFRRTQISDSDEFGDYSTATSIFAGGAGYEFNLSPGMGVYGEGAFGLASFSSEFDGQSFSDSGTAFILAGGLRYNMDAIYASAGLTRTTISIDAGEGVSVSSTDMTVDLWGGYAITEAILVGAAISLDPGDFTEFSLAGTYRF